MDDRVKRVFDGLSVVAIGLVFLGNTLGVIEWSVWLNILSLWPLLVVAIGVDLIGKSIDSGLVRALSSLVFIGGLAYAVFVMPAEGWPGTLGFDLERREAVEFSGSTGSAEGVEDAEARIDAAVGRLIVEGTAGELVEWEGRSPGGAASVNVSREDSSAVVRVSSPDDVPRVFSSGRRRRLTLRLNEDPTWTIRFDSGVGELDADLSELRVQRLDVDSGIGTGTLRLGDPLEGSRVRFASGISTARLLLPEDAEARVRFRSGIGSRDLPEDFERTGDDVYETPGFDDAVEAWDIVIESGIGTLDVETY